MTCGRGWLGARFCWSARLEKDGGSTLHLGRRDVLDPLAHHPLLAEGIAQKRPIVVFQPIGAGWVVRPVHTAPNMVKTCAHLRMRTSINAKTPGSRVLNHKRGE
jgi:hypothetical protein